MKAYFALCLMMFAAPTGAFASGNGVGNGGDICEKRIQDIRTDLTTWITSGGSAGLQLPTGLSYSQYNQGMLQGIGAAVVSCTDSTLTVGNAEKTCKNFVAQAGSRLINCNIQRFMSTNESDQYVLIHHEYAGIAGFETNTNESSNYLISNQITGFLVDQTVKKLGIKLPYDPSQDVFNPAICQGPLFSAADAARAIKNGEPSGVLGKYSAYTRVRSCNLLNGCGPWRKAEAMAMNDGWYYEKDGVRLVVFTTQDSPFFRMSLQHSFNGPPRGQSNTKEVATGRSDKLAFPAAREILPNAIVSTLNMNYDVKSSGAFHQSCGWFDSHVTQRTNGDGTYLEGDVVYYGIH